MVINDCGTTEPPYFHKVMWGGGGKCGHFLNEKVCFYRVLWYFRLKNPIKSLLHKPRAQNLGGEAMISCP